MTNHALDLLTQQVEKLSPHEQLLLIERIVALLKTRETEQEEESALETEEYWIEEELEELQALIESKESLTGREIVEKHTALGNIGTWADLGIENGAEWVNQQKAKRRKKYQW
ncbi:MAG: hypothetical protein L0154_12105 [Chloroflexi bacterium]|nr:hypothetical protein [Chloroflexota bacterium]